jgi:hypothetical protein
VQVMRRRREGQPAEHPIPQLTDFELRRLREELEQKLAKDELPSWTRPRAELEQTLADIKAEQDDRVRIRHEPMSDDA